MSTINRDLKIYMMEGRILIMKSEYFVGGPGYKCGLRIICSGTFLNNQIRALVS